MTFSAIDQGVPGPAAEAVTRSVISSVPGYRRRRALVFAGGDAPPALDSIDGLLPMNDEDVVIAADRGLIHCLDAGLRPRHLLGDFDSVPPELLERDDLASIPRTSFPQEKNASDLELALASLAASCIDDVLLLGISGGRTDHLLFNWLLPLARDWPFSLRLIDSTIDARVVTPSRPSEFYSPADALVSLVPLRDCAGISTSGLRYPLRDHAMSPGSTLGLSNVACGGLVHVSVRTGTLLAARVR